MLVIRPLVAALSTSPGIFSSIDVATLWGCCASLIVIIVIIVIGGSRWKATPPGAVAVVALSLLLVFV